MRSERAALITGGGRGLGRAIGERLAGEGWTVGLLARSKEQVAEAAEAIRRGGGQSRGLVADVLEASTLHQAVEEFAGWSGRIDALVCAAGSFQAIGPLVEVDSDHWWRDIEVSIRGAQQAIQAVWPYLQQSDRGSISLLVGPGYAGELAFGTAYGLSQAALVRLAESLAVELQDSDVAVFALYPGLVPTDLIRHLLDSPEGRQWLPRFNEAFAEGKEVGPEFVAEMATWLLDRRPKELSGRVVAAPLSPEILETRLARIVAEDLNRLRLR